MVGARWPLARARWLSGIAVALLGVGACGGEEAGSDAVDGALEVDARAEVDAVEGDGDAGAETSVGDGGGEVVPDDVADANAEVEVEGDVEHDGGDGAPSTSGFPSHGLVVRILEPGAMGIAETIGDVTVISGALFGEAETMTWQAGTQSGVVTPGVFWQSGQVRLAPGDNRITVTASGGGRSVSDTIVVTYNPAFRFDEALVARPRALWVGAESEVVFTMAASRFASADRESMRLLRVDADGGLLSDEGQLEDDGRVSTSGDEIEQDGVFTFNGRYTCTEPGPLFFRVSVKVGTAPSYTAVSSTVRIECLERVTPQQCNAHRSLVEAAGAALEGGAEIAEVEAQLAAEAEVAAVGRAEDGSRALWVMFGDGLLGAVVAPESGVRGGVGELAARLVAGGAVAAPTVLLQSKRALVLSPRATEFGETDEGERVAEVLGGIECPRFEVTEGRAQADSEASIDRFRAAAGHGVVAIASEGEVLFGGLDPALVRERYGWRHTGAQEVLWTGSPVSCDGLLQTEIACQVTSASPGGGCPVGARCVVTRGLASDSVTTGQGVCVDETQVDLRLGNAVISNRGYAVTPRFFETWRGRGFPASLVHLGACRTMWNGSLASSLYAAGARAVTGFSGAVDSAWARARAVAMFEALAGASDGTVGALHEPAEDPSHPGTFWRLFGATNLDLRAAGLLNGDFETGSLVGWRASGDGRAVAQFGEVQPVSGKGMGLVSSGLGFSVETGTLEQTFCIPEGREELVLSWKFMSEEFKEWCGNTKFQDRFEAELVDAQGGAHKLVEVRVDDLCGYADGTCTACPAPRACDAACFAQEGCYLSEDGGACGGAFNCQCGREFVGLSASSIGFDQGGVYEVMWRQSRLDVRELAGRGPVTLRLSVEDSGDSLFDTAVLLDAIEVR